MPGEGAYSHRPVRTGSGPQAARVASFKWVNTTLGNIKSAITGTYRKLSPDHAERYLASFAWRYIRGLIERIVLKPSENWAEMDAVLHGDLGTILEWARNGRENTRTDIPMPEMSVSVVAGAGFVPAFFRL